MATRSVKPDAKALEAIRLQRGLTLDEFAQACGLSGRTMDNVMAGEKVLVSTLARIADKLGVDLASITEGGAPEPPEGKLKPNSALPVDSAPVDLLKGDEQRRTIFYVIGKFPSGNPFWVFVAVKANQCERFIEAHKAGTLDLYDFSSYGEIIVSGTELEGYYPPLATIDTTASLVAPPCEWRLRLLACLFFSLPPTKVSSASTTLPSPPNGSIFRVRIASRIR